MWAVRIELERRAVCPGRLFCRCGNWTPLPSPDAPVRGSTQGWLLQRPLGGRHWPQGCRANWAPDCRGWTPESDVSKLPVKGHISVIFLKMGIKPNHYKFKRLRLMWLSSPGWGLSHSAGKKFQVETPFKPRGSYFSAWKRFLTC